jgi:hypothetical protein
VPRSAIVSFDVVPCEFNYVLLVKLEKREEVLEEECGDLCNDDNSE